MAPDLNSLPASRPSPTLSAHLAERSRRSSNDADAPPSPRSPGVSSLQAAAAINAGLHHSPPGGATAAAARRRSSLLSTLNDPAMPAPGEMQPRRLDSGESRMSLGQLHQELENEQEAQVNRLLHMIRQQQDQLAALTPETSVESSSAIVDSVPQSRATQSNALPRTISRQSSSRWSAHGASSRGASPALAPLSANISPLAGDFTLGGSRDEAAFYQAETQALTRENQMLKHRIRELERQISEMGATAAGTIPMSQSPLASPAITNADTNESKE